MRINFVSGHLDLTFEEFKEHYVPHLHAGFRRGDSFVVGDARGVDKFAQSWLGAAGGVNITVYHMLKTPRYNVYNAPTCGGFATDEERDKAMTEASTHDIAWVKPGREKSGTAKNLKRREVK